MALLSELLAAQLTLVRFDSQMRVDVMHKVSLYVKLFLALVTLIDCFLL